MSLQVPALSGQDTAIPVEVSEAVFGQKYNEALIHQMVTRHLAGARAGTKAQKSRAEVSGGGAKPWRQKGSGRARAGSSRSPLWRSGGVTFAAKPRSYDQKLNKKMFRAGIRSILSELLRQNRLMVSESILPRVPKTKELSSKIKDLGCERILILTDGKDVNLFLAARNLPQVEVCTPNNLNPVMLVSADLVIATQEALKSIEEHLG